MLLFVDESGTDRRGTPYEVLAGVAISESQLWALIQSIRAAERDHFGCTIGELGMEFKGKKLLKRKTFRHAGQSGPIPASRRQELTHRFLEKGVRAKDGENVCFASEEFAAYGQAVLAFVEAVYELCAQLDVRVFASMVSLDSPLPQEDLLRKDYCYLFERYFHCLESVSDEEMGLVVFDELERARCHRLLDQMERYFLRSGKGRYRSKRIVPEPFFVHSDLSTAVQIADIVAYSLNWGVRLRRMTQPTRPEMERFGRMALGLQYIGMRGARKLYGVKYIDDLRGKEDRS